MPNNPKSWEDITGWTGTFTGKYECKQDSKETIGENTSERKLSISTTFSARLKLDRVDPMGWKGSADATIDSVQDGALILDGVAAKGHSETKGSGPSPTAASLWVSPSDGTFGISPGSAPSTTVESADGVETERSSGATGFPNAYVDLIPKSASLPKSPGAIAGSLAGGNTPSGETWSMTWALTPTGTREMTADIRVRPAKPRRGDPVTLTAIVKNASKDRQYSWTYTSPDGDTLSPDAGENADTTTVVLLKDVTVTLTVTDGNRKVVATRTIAVAPRRPAWKVKVLPPVDDKAWDGGEILKEGGQCGVTHCHACDGHHAIHYTELDYSDVVTLEQLDDEFGPHHGWWWVTESRLKSQLVCHVNAYLRSRELANLPGQRASDVRAMQRQVHDHEHAHVTVCKQAIEEFDPSKDVEAFVRPANDEIVRDRLRVLLVEAESKIWEKTCDEAACKALLVQWAHPGRLVLKNTNHGFDVVNFPSMQDLGEQI